MPWLLVSTIMKLAIFLLLTFVYAAFGGDTDFAFPLIHFFSGNSSAAEDGNTTECDDCGTEGGTSSSSPNEHQTKTIDTVTADPCSEIPETPNIIVTLRTATSVVVEWNVTEWHVRCVNYYQISYKSGEFDNKVNISQSQATNKAVNTTATQPIIKFSIENLSPCGEYNISMKPVTRKGKFGQPKWVITRTLEIDPGQVRNFTSQANGNDPSSVVLQWEKPQVGAECIDSYNISYWLEDQPQKPSVSKVSNNTSVVIIGLQACGTYVMQIVGITKENSAGTPAEIKVPTKEGAPGKPRNLFFTEVGPNFLNLSWDPPEENVLCVHQYLVEIFEMPEQITPQINPVNPKEIQPSASYSTTDTKFIISGLFACTKYSARVTALTLNGTKGDSQSAVQNTKDVAPGEAKNLTVESVESQSMTVQWELPAENSQCLKGYLISIFKSDGNLLDSSPLNADQTSHTLDGLHGCTEYNITLLTKGSNGLEGKLAWVTETTSEEVPGPPDVSYSPGPYFIQLNWTAPTVDEGRSCVAAYNVSWGISSVEVSATQYEVKNLAPCSTYEVSVTAVTPSGQEGMRKTMLINTLAAAPGQVENLTVQDIQPHSLMPTWEPPEENSPCLEGYVISLYNSDGSFINSHSLDTEQTGYQLENLQACTEYNVSVLTKGRSGLEGKLSWIQEKTSEEEPGPPDRLDHTSHPYSLELKWTAPKLGQSCVSKYKVSWMVDGDNETSREVSETAYEIEHLSACSIYNISVVAKTPLGQEGENKEVQLETLAAVTPPLMNGNARNITATSALVQWELPDLSNNDCTIRHYNITCRSEKEEGLHLVVSGVHDEDNTVEFEMERLFPYRNYTCVAMIHNEGGYSDESDPVKFETAEAVPTPPENLQTNDVTKTSFAINWAKPAYIPGKFGDYEVFVECIYDPCSNCESGQLLLKYNTTETTYNFDLASPYSSYSVYVRAYTGAGYSNMSGRVNVTTMQSVPSPPHNVNVSDIGSTYMTIHWERPKCIPGILKSYVLNLSCEPPEITECAETGRCEVNSFSIPVEGSFSVWNFTLASPYTSYTVVLEAETEAGFGTQSEVKVVQTGPSAPGPVYGMKLDIINYTSATLVWKVPCRLTGELDHFVGYYNGTRDPYLPESFHWETPSNPEGDEYKYTFTNLSAVYTYNMSVAAAVKGVDQVGDFKSTSGTTPSGIPPKPSKESVVKIFDPDPSATEEPTEMAEVHISKDWFSADMGDVLYFALIVAEADYQEPVQNGYLDSMNEWPDALSWFNVSNGEKIMPYQATPVRWEPFADKQEKGVSVQNRVKRAAEGSVSYVLGHDGKCLHSKEIYCNGALRPGTSYSVKIRAFTANGYQDSDPVIFETESAIAVGVVIGIIVAVILVGMLSIMLLLVRRGRVTWPPKLPIMSQPRRPAPIPLSRFSSHCDVLLQNPNRLCSEFHLIGSFSADAAGSTEIASLPQNKVKNRYVNVLPYDSTRVKLKIFDDDPTSDYINASFIRGYSGEVEYVASQGPKEETIEDFWRMIWEHDILLVVMVTQFVEKEKRKCHPYFPAHRNTLDIGEFTIKCATELNYPVYTHRTLYVKKEDKQKTVTHFHFREWSDFGCPVTTDLMIQFCQLMRYQVSMTGNHILVHCSAGVGRTGTFIAIDILLQHIKENKKVDIFGTVLNLRAQRMNMVQTESQYQYIYKCVKDALEDPSFLRPGKSSNSSLEPIYANVGVNHISAYEKLSSESQM